MPETRFEHARTSQRLSTALEAVRAALGFETASLFAGGPAGWRLLARVGPSHDWHALLDPAALAGTDLPAEYTDAGDIPGIGARLTSLGCGSLAVLPLPDGSRLLLDSSTARTTDGWIERAAPYLSLVEIMAGPGWAGGALRGHQEVEALQRVFAASQHVLQRTELGLDDLLTGVRGALRAHELFVLTERGLEMEVAASPADHWPAAVPAEVLSDLSVERGPLPPELCERLALALGISSPSLAGAVGRDGDRMEVLLAGWDDGLTLSPVSMAVVARAVSTTLAALEGRQEAVINLVDRERSKMAYELHDGLIQTVTSAVLQLEALRRKVERDPADALETLETSKAEIRKALAELRAVLFDLSNPRSEVKRAETLRRDVEDVVKRWRLPADVTVEGDLQHVPQDVLSVAYLVIREALTNAAKHAAGSNVSVTVAATDTTLFVSVGDTGPGYEPTRHEVARQEHHVGLDLLRRRVEEIGGELQVEGRTGRGTKVVALLPTPEEVTR